MGFFGIGNVSRGHTDKPGTIDRDGRAELSTLKKHCEMWGANAHQRLLTFWASLYFGNPYILDDELAPFEDDVDSADQGSEYTVKMRPLMQRRPNVRASEGRKLINRQTAMLVGRSRFPEMWVEDLEGNRLSDATATMTNLLIKAKFRALMRSAIRWMCIEGASAATFNPVPRGGGRIYPIYYPAHECLPEFGWDNPDEADRLGIDPDDLTKLTVTRVYQAPPGEDRLSSEGVWYVHRRIFLPDRIQDFEPMKMEGDIFTAVPDFKLRKEDVHNLGFVPAVWFRNSDLDENPWGSSIFDGIESMLLKVDYGLSQEWRAAMYHGDPALCPKDANAANMMPAGSRIDKGAIRTQSVPMEFLEIDGKGQDVQRTIRKDTQKQIQEVTGLHIHDPESAAGTVSGKALEFRYEPTVNQTQEMREIIEDPMSRLARSIFVGCIKRGIVSTPRDLPKISSSWRVGINWPPIYDRTAADYQETGQAILTLRTAEVVDRETAFDIMNEMLGGKFDKRKVMAALDEEEKKAQEMAADAARLEDRGNRDDEDDES